MGWISYLPFFWMSVLNLHFYHLETSRKTRKQTFHSRIAQTLARTRVLQRQPMSFAPPLVLQVMTSSSETVMGYVVNTCESLNIIGAAAAEG